MPLPPASALVVPVPDADPVVGAWRLAHDPAAAQGVGAHVTLLYPFLPPDALDGSALARVADLAAAAAAAPLRFPRTRRLDGLLVLDPDPPDALDALRTALRAAWPALVPYGGRYGPRPPLHLTVAYSADRLTAGAADFAPIEAALSPHLPLVTRAETLALEVRRGDRWRVEASWNLISR